VGIDRLRHEYEVQIRWTAFPLHPETPEEGLTLEALFIGRSISVTEMMSRLRTVAEDLGLPLGERKKTYNSRLAQELAKWAESKGKGDDYHDVVFRTYFVDGRNIAKVGELALLAKSVGLPEQEAREVLESRTFRKEVDADWARSRSMGITAVPTFVMDHQVVVGFQPYEVLDQLLKTNRVRKRT
jgi:predicted DsbA family dithiol-disulfide isomerase